MELVGLRVIRGRDWNSDDVDGGEGHVGTIVSVGGLQTVDVVWDNGKRNACRIGQSEKYDLRIFDNGTVGVRHTGYSCIVCSEQDICGMRWRCTVCKDCNLCPLCYVTDKHDIHHEFTRFVSPGDPGTKVTKRANAFKVQSLGIFPGAIVRRGKDWKWENQDGGDGKTGEVLKVKDHKALKRCLLNIKWTATGKTNIYRLGVDGYVDVQFVQESRGIFYYRDHLPDCKKYTDTPSQGEEADARPSTQSGTLKEGDKVCIMVSEERLESIQRKHSTFTRGMKDCVGKSGEIKGTAPGGDFMTEFNDRMFRFHPSVLKKIENIEVGDRVRILSDKSKVKSLQENHGEYNSQMDEFCGKVGLVVKKNQNDDVVVKFGRRIYIYNPACCEMAPAQSVYEAGDIGPELLGGMGLEHGLLGMLEYVSRMGDKTIVAMLMKEINDGNTEQAISIIRRKPDVVNASIQGLTPLMLACNEGNRAVVDELLDKGANVNTLEKGGNSTLNAALAGNENRTIAKILIKHGVNVNVIPDDKATAAHQAALLGYADVLDMMIEKGCNVNLKDKKGNTPIHLAIFNGNTEAVRSLCRARDIDLTISNDDGFFPMALAALRGRPEAIEAILDKSKDTVNKHKGDGFTPLHVAAVNDHTDCARILLHRGKAEVNSRDSNNCSPLHGACTEGYDKMVELLIENNADINALSRNNDTPLHLALLGNVGLGGLGSLMHMFGALIGESRSLSNAESRLKIAKMLMEKGASLSKRNKVGQTPLDMCQDSQLKKAVTDLFRQRTGQKVPLLSELLTSTRKCIKCKSEKADIELKPCGHTCLCESCASDAENCPRCEQRIEHTNLPGITDDGQQEDDEQPGNETQYEGQDIDGQQLNDAPQDGNEQDEDKQEYDQQNEQDAVVKDKHIKRKWSETENTIIKKKFRIRIEKKVPVRKDQLLEVQKLLNGRALAVIRTKINNMRFGKST